MPTNFTAIDPDGSSDVAAIVRRLASDGRFERPLEAFTPWDNIPWEAQAEQLLRCRAGESFIGLRSPVRVDREVRGLVAQLELAPGDPVLDLGCGPGLLGNRLGAVGVRVTGVDIAEPVLAYAQRQADAEGLPCRYQRASFLALEFAEEFCAAFLANSIFNQLGDRECVELLDGVRRGLRPGGLFACEVYLALPHAEDRAEQSEVRRLYSLPYSPWSDRPHHWLERIVSFPAQRQRVTQHLILHEDGTIAEHWSRSRLLDRSVLEQAFERAGLSVRGWLGRDLSSPAEALGEEAWVVARRSDEAGR